MDVEPLMDDHGLSREAASELVRRLKSEPLAFWLFQLRSGVLPAPYQGEPTQAELLRQRHREQKGTGDSHAGKSPACAVVTL